MGGKRLDNKRRCSTKKIGITNCLAIYILVFLTLGLIGGFILSILSIKHNYTGALACYTVVFAPIGTVAGIVLGKVVDKNKAENIGGNGDGITFAAAKAAGFIQCDAGRNESPAI